MRVADIVMGLTTPAKNGMARATAVVKVLDGSGNVVSGATVTGTWSGIISANGSALSGSSGVASFTSPQTRAAGTFVFTVTGITLAGYSYDAMLNAETSDSISR